MAATDTPGFDIAAFLFLTIVANILLGGSVFAATMPAVRMKVVDEETGAPLAGVVVQFQGTARAGTWTGHGGTYAVLFSTEAVSDEAGDFRFPKQDFASRPFFLNTNYENPSMLLLKAGYAPLVVQNQLRIVPNLDEVSTWEHDGRTVKMKKAPPADVTSMSSYLVALRLNMVAGDCMWKQVPRTIVRAHRALPNPGMSTTLEILQLNDSLYVKKGCGSPNAFLEPYLREEKSP